ncbi:hypothetical protein JMN32_07210 [Fulvivirga sp. 29W222]|uniref:Uncharacterized protein n=1 Tax=Fulvivirga marina TaxID=2494733 RepID=A0A937KBJ1_9BACT|nr:hypothetical protein [Fulvivirga marina]MBL6446089.1 hypothetical protein [Fulvivirga marina]
MNLEVPVQDLELMFKHLSDHFKVKLDKAGFLTIADAIKDVDYRYLSEKLYGQMTEANKNSVEEINLRLEKLNTIVKHIGFGNFIDFQNYLKIDPLLLQYVGNYYSLIRKNARETEILQSPVKIQRMGHLVRLTLIGQDRVYFGDLEIQDGCMTCLMRSKERDKSFYHVYKVGKIKNPRIMQGIFAGASSFDEPIGGRCILLKQEEEFTNLVNKKINMIALKSGDNNNYKQLTSYFERYEENNLKLGVMDDFSI